MTSCHLAVWTVIVSVVLVVPVRTLNPGPACVPGAPGYNATDPSAGWSFRFEPGCLANDSRTPAALSYIQVSLICLIGGS